jgi:hypothetical protein
MGGCELNLSGLGYGSGEGCYKYGNESSDSLKRWDFFEWLSNCWLLKKDATPQRYLVS